MRKFNCGPYKNITIIGSSKKHYDKICEVRQTFIKHGFNVLFPNEGSILDKSEVYFLYAENLLKIDLVYVCDVDGYVDPIVQFEIKELISNGQEVFFLEQPSDPLLSSICNTSKTNLISSPEDLCNELNRSNVLLQLKEWRDSFRKNVPGFSLNSNYGRIKSLK